MHTNLIGKCKQAVEMYGDGETRIKYKEINISLTLIYTANYVFYCAKYTYTNNRPFLCTAAHTHKLYNMRV